MGTSSVSFSSTSVWTGLSNVDKSPVHLTRPSKFWDPMMIFAVLQCPSFPADVPTTRARRHSFLGRLSALMRTTSPTHIFLRGDIHLERTCNVWRNSFFPTGPALVCKCWTLLHRFLADLSLGNYLVVVISPLLSLLRNDLASKVLEILDHGYCQLWVDDYWQLPWLKSATCQNRWKNIAHSAYLSLPCLRHSLLGFKYP